ncbi:DUF2267 domain-containing protein [Bounagaea algeriensis]
MQYEDMVEGLRQRASLEWSAAETVLAATLQALDETAHTAVAALRAQLPGELKRVEPAGMNPDRSWDEFVVRVGELSGAADEGQVGDQLRAAFAVLTEAVSPGQVRELLAALPAEFRDAVPGSIGLSGSAETLLGQVRQRVEVDTLEQARELTEGVLSALAEHSSAGQARDLALRLPADFGDALRITRSVSRTEAEDFLAGVSDRVSATNPNRVREDTAHVFGVLRQWAPEELEATLSQLPETVTALAR